MSAWTPQKHNLMCNRIVALTVEAENLRQKCAEAIEIIQTHDATNQPTWVDPSNGIPIADITNCVSLMQDFMKLVGNQNVATADRRPVIQAIVATVSR